MEELPREGFEPEALAGEPRSLQIVAAVLLGLVTVTSAWCGFQAHAWGGEQATATLQASARSALANQATTVAARQTLVDVTLFAHIVEAKHRGDEQLLVFARDRMRPDFRSAVDAWLAQARSGSVPPGTPFEQVEYAPPAQADTQRLRQQSVESADQAHRANRLSARYVSMNVVLAGCLFFLGIAPQFKLRGLRRAVLALAGAIWVLVVMLVLRMPAAFS
jgi:hypothetical protein